MEPESPGIRKGDMRPGRVVLFVDGLWTEKFGIMSLIPHLEERGCKVHLLLTRNGRVRLREVERLRPQVVAFSATTGYHQKALSMATLVKEHFPATLVALGGPHVTYFPEVACHKSVDLAFRGECDAEFAKGLALLEAGESPENIPNLVVRMGESLVMGPLSPLIEDLDSLPLPDRTHYYSYRFFRNSPYKSFIVSRGCPYDCAFCFNHKLRCLYRGMGRFVRLRSPESVVEEALQVKNRYGMKLASFEDDLLTFDRDWLERLVVAWKRKVGVPYNINATARELGDESLVKLLKETGVWCVAFGVETGSESLRRELLNKPVSDEQIVRAGEALNRHRVNFMTYNMFALPGETLADAISTLRLNRRIGTRLARYTLFEPYPGTQLGDKLLAEPGGELLYYRSGTREPDARRIERLQKYAMLGMRWSGGEKLALVASRLPLGPAHTAVFWATYFEVVRKYMQTGRLHLLELGLRSLTDIL